MCGLCILRSGNYIVSTTYLLIKNLHLQLAKQYGKKHLLEFCKYANCRRTNQKASTFCIKSFYKLLCKCVNYVNFIYAQLYAIYFGFRIDNECELNDGRTKHRKMRANELKENTGTRRRHTNLDTPTHTYM